MSTEDDLHRLRQAWKYADSEARRQFWLEVLQQQGMAGESEIRMTSQVNSRDGAPAVLLQWGDKVLQLESPTAKQHALAILETAMGADADAFLFHWVKTVVGGPPEMAASLLMDFRAWRDQEAQRRATEDRG